MGEKRRVLFLCTGNSVRSQMAEAIVNHELGKTWQAFSAGTKPTGFVHPYTIKALKEIGIDHQGSSKSSEIYHDQVFDVVITVCDEAAENCPVWLGKGKKVHISFHDPAKTRGSEEEQMQSFRSVRDEIRKKIPALLSEFSTGGEIFINLA
jgi:arsenate reductase (thioredoxin)